MTAMTKFDRSIVIAASPRKVFDYLSQPGHLAEFMPMSDLQYLTDTHRGVGMRFRYTCTIGGKKMSTECSLTELEQDKRVRFHTTKGMKFDWTATVNAVEGGTEVHWDCEYEMPIGSMDRMLGRGGSLTQSMETALDESLRKLKSELESS
jgi:carbon monoxide dehydrogenase subunit G